MPGPARVPFFKIILFKNRDVFFCSGSIDFLKRFVLQYHLGKIQHMRVKNGITHIGVFPEFGITTDPAFIAVRPRHTKTEQKVKSLYRAV